MHNPPRVLRCVYCKQDYIAKGWTGKVCRKALCRFKYNKDRRERIRKASHIRYHKTKNFKKGEKSFFQRFPKRLPSFKEGRICAIDKCTTVINIYNPSKYCNIHKRMVLMKEAEHAKRGI